MTTKSIHSVPALCDLVEAGAAVIHVLPDDHFAAAHVPGAINACVYEMTFLPTVRQHVPDLSSPVIVYGAGHGSRDSSTAAEKLTQAGYACVYDFAGGLAEWVAAGRSTEGTGEFPEPPVPHGTYEIDTEASLVRWTGRNLFNHHHGTLKFASGSLRVDHGRMVTGRLTLDMTSLACEDITDPEMNSLLIRHLQDDDFFAIDRFPTAECLITAAEPVAEAPVGSTNWSMHADLTVRGVTCPISFLVVIAAADAEHVTGQAQIDVDRTQFGSLYGSGKFFAFLGRHVVNDLVSLHLKVHARRA